MHQKRLAWLVSDLGLQLSQEQTESFLERDTVSRVFIIGAEASYSTREHGQAQTQAQAHGVA